MNKIDLIKDIADDLYFDETIRDGIYKAREQEKYQDLYMVAHGGDFLLNDMRYKMIYDIINQLNEWDKDEIINDCVDDLELLDGLIPIYTYDLTKWLNSSNSRYSYVDEAVAELGHGDSILDDIKQGYLQELLEVYYLMKEWIDENSEEENEEE